jgi:hypothetical protein
MLKNLFTAAVVVLSVSVAYGQPSGNLDQEKRSLEAEMRKMAQMAADVRAKSEALKGDYAPLLRTSEVGYNVLT